MSQKQNEEWGLQSVADYDEYKRIWIETDPILFAVTMVVSILHTLFEMLAFKNDIQFWKGKESLEGISVKSLYMQIGMSTIVLLYLLDNDTSLLISAPHFLSIILDIWKLSQASKVTFSGSFPFVKIEDRETYSETETKKYDAIAMKYLSWVMYPLMIGYTIYSAYYNERKSWYSFTLGTLVGGIYLFGFI